MTLQAVRSKAIPFFMALVLLMQSAATATAVPEPESAPGDDIHRMLEQSLSIKEIDKEIERIREEKKQLASEMDEQAAQLDVLEGQIRDKREDVGEVLRAYYMGEREVLLEALFSAKSISALLGLLDYIGIIFGQDKRTLNDYKQQYAELQEGYLILEDQQTRLDGIESSLARQRERVLAMEAELNEQLESRPDADRIRMMIEELNSFWETAGLYEVEQYFNALSDAMGKLPDWIQEHKEFLAAEGLTYTLRIPEDDLNAFLREQNELFDRFSFRFHDGKVTAEGSRNGIDVHLTGSYTVVEQPQNGLRFHVEELRFNGYALPDTTREELEERFDLAFYPGLILSFVKATSVEAEDGELIVELGLNW